MNIQVIAIGKTDSKALAQLISEYANRLGHYVNFEMLWLPDIKNTKALSEKNQKLQEAQLILKKVKPSDHVILFDEKGKTFSSVEFSEHLQKRMNSGLKQLTFVIGGPYGFDEVLYQRAQEKISLSKMTFSHQMVRLLVVEQIYRAFTILRNEPYHHR
ncbi:MAG: 23S rRNA (pseudouridine(1915)-N(3))-methyltransferase RlmH [Bacteroidota bacterium]